MQFDTTIAVVAGTNLKPWQKLKVALPIAVTPEVPNC
jgi:hypothetical protein